jgi:hypothetical protein
MERNKLDSDTVWGTRYQLTELFQGSLNPTTKSNHKTVPPQAASKHAGAGCHERDTSGSLGEKPRKGLTYPTPCRRTAILQTPRSPPQQQAKRSAQRHKKYTAKGI